MGNHVYYGRYLEFLEAARGEFFRRLGQPLLRLQDEDVIFPVIECHVTYKAPGRYDDVLTIEVSIGKLERVRIEFDYRVRNQAMTETLVASTMHVCTAVNEKPKRIPLQLMTILQPYVCVSEAK